MARGHGAAVDVVDDMDSVDVSFAEGLLPAACNQNISWLNAEC